MLKIVLFFILGLTASSHAGSLSESLIKSFGSGGDGEKDVILEFPPVINGVLSNSQLSGLTGDDRNNMIVSLMQASTSASQAPVLNALSSLGFSDDQVTPFWVDNKVAIRGAELGPLQALAALPGAFTVREPFQAKVYSAQEVDEQKLSLRQAANDPPQWGVAKINAPAVWEAGFTGQGIVAGIIDTGVNVAHIALKDNYQNGPFSWKDAFSPPHETPYDGNGHGTHCAGTIAGNVNGIGVATGAKYMACRGLDDKGSGSEITLTTCGQFMACPSNTPGNCTGMPNIVSNSWGGAFGGQSWFDNTIKLWNSMGIIGIFAIGNSGQLGCATAGSPGDRAGVISVGSTDDNDGISSFSSRGPSLSTLKTSPTIAAPGRNILSADFNNTTGYKALSGTSMATPHVAGAVALLLSAHPTWNRTTIETALTKTAFRKKLGFFDSFTVCGLPNYPNNAYGSGRIDVFQAYNAKL